LVEKGSGPDRLTKSSVRPFRRTFRLGMSCLGGTSIAMYASSERIYSRPETSELGSLAHKGGACTDICPLSPSQICSLRSGISS
jgi:hypothetical protein